MADEKPVALYSPGTLEYSLLYGPLAKPQPRTQRSDAHRPHAPRPTWTSVTSRVIDQLVPLHANLFQYSSLGDGEIRILCLEPGRAADPLRALLFKRSLREVANGYEALSYCWGDVREKPVDKIQILDLNAVIKDRIKTPSVAFRKVVQAKMHLEFKIRRNLHQALVKLRSENLHINVWVDAICIDQSDRGKKEKESQLAMMADIYNSAANVCIWLGESYEGAKSGFSLVTNIMNFQHFDSIVSQPNRADGWSHLVQIINAAWFTRRWIIQEVALSKNATIHCADQVIHWDDFADAVSLMMEKIEAIRGTFRDDETFDDVEASSACILIHTLTNVCRKGNDGKILARLLDLETLVSTLISFNASDPRDVVYSILSLARDLPRKGESWEALHQSQLDLNRSTAVAHGGVGRAMATMPSISLEPNYSISTRDVFIAFVTRCIHTSRCLDIICRHWAPEVKDAEYGQVVRMPSWISGVAKAPFGLPGKSLGRQNGENFVAYSYSDQRRRYSASGEYPADFRMVDDEYLDDDARLSRSRSITGTPIVQTPMVEKSSFSMPSITEDNGSAPERGVGDAPATTAAALAVHSTRPRQHSNPETNGATLSITTPKTSRRLSQSINQAMNSNLAPPSIQSLGGRGAPPSPRGSVRRNTNTPDRERKHQLSGIMAVKGFVLGAVTDRSDVMRGGIVPGDWIARTGWNHSNNYENRVPDALWRLLVADRARRGGRPPQWYKRACLHGLVDPRLTDAGGNVHSVTPLDRKVSELTTEYFGRVESVVWNRRLIAADPYVPELAPDQGLFLGLAPPETDMDDIVCILFGCSVPVVLRPDRQAFDPRLEVYNVVGEAYIHGMMDGEAVQKQAVFDPHTKMFNVA